MLDTLIGLASTGGVGAAVGLVGSVATKWLEFKSLDKKLDYEKEMASLRLKEQELEQAHELQMADKEMQRAELEGEIQADAGELAAFIESQKSNSVPATGPVGAFRSAMRPGITTYLLFLTTLFAVLIWNQVGGIEALGKDALLEIFTFLIYQVVFLTVTAVTWWFGSRPSEEWRKGILPKFHRS